MSMIIGDSTWLPGFPAIAVAPTRNSGYGRHL
jgi:hypothetical protein